MGLKVKSGGSWVSPTSFKVKSGGSWVDGKVHIKSGGSWDLVYPIVPWSNSKMLSLDGVNDVAILYGEANSAHYSGTMYPDTVNWLSSFMNSTNGGMLSFWCQQRKSSASFDYRTLVCHGRDYSYGTSFNAAPSVGWFSVPDGVSSTYYSSKINWEFLRQGSSDTGSSSNYKKKYISNGTAYDEYPLTYYYKNRNWEDLWNFIVLWVPPNVGQGSSASYAPTCWCIHVNYGGGGGTGRDTAAEGRGGMEGSSWEQGYTSGTYRGDIVDEAGTDTSGFLIGDAVKRMLNSPIREWEGYFHNIAFWDNVSEPSDALITAMLNSGTPIDLSQDSGNYNISSNLALWWDFQGLTPGQPKVNNLGSILSSYTETPTLQFLSGASIVNV